MARVFKPALFILFILIPAAPVFSQDTLRNYVVYDQVKGLINEQTLTFGHCFGRRHLASVSLGYNFVNRFLQEELLSISPSQDTNPTLIYTGPVVRANYGYRMTRIFYVGADVGYKHLHYNDHIFHDEDGYDHAAYYRRSEKMQALVGHVNFGLLFPVHSIPLTINPVVGFGGYVKYRHYTTYNVNNPSGDFPIFVGTFSKWQDGLSVIFIVNIGVRF